jgi:acyl-CoA synthetase (AMP-forming)/AMP-acid ligase II
MWSVVAAGAVCAVLNPVSTEPKTAAGQLENVKMLFGDAPILTSQKLASIFVPHGLNVKAVERLCRSRLNCAWAVNLRQTASPDDIAMLLFTSGSTGHSKAVKFSHRQLIASVQAKSSYLCSRGMTFMSWICE